MSDTSDLSHRAKENASELGTKAKAAAANEAVAQADKVKDAAADKVQQTADAAGAAASELDPASPQAQAVKQVADRIEGIATKLRTADIRQLADQATDMARRNPLLFIGGAAIAGFAAARFLKARDPQAAGHPDHDDPWAVHQANVGGNAVMANINGGRTDG